MTDICLPHGFMRKLNEDISVNVTIGYGLDDRGLILNRGTMLLLAITPLSAPSSYSVALIVLSPR